MKFASRFKKPVYVEIVFFLSAFLFSWFLMSKTLRLTPNGNFEIATKAWSDLSATIPLIRSFSFGSNFPPEYPLFAGSPIRYHFVFFLLVGLLEKIGLALPFALNFLSALVFSLLIFLIYFLGKTIFRKRSVGVIAATLFLFNGSFAFLEFFNKNPLSGRSILEIINNTDFATFGPYDGKIVSAFWSLNIFTNQRHLALAYSAFLLLILLVYRFAKGKSEFTYGKAILLGIFIGVFPFIHLAIFGALGIALATFFIIYPKLRRQIIVSGVVALILALPQFIYFQGGVSTQIFNPGYLIHELTPQNFTVYWFLNLGLTLILAPIGFFLANKSQRKILIPFLSLFIIGNLFQFSVEISANHKFFNLFVIGLNFFTVYLLIYLWGKSLLGKILVPILLFFLLFSGVIDFFPIVNDSYVEILDIENNKTANFILENTPPDSVFLNSSFLYDPASIAGRKIYLGWPYFSWSAGYNTELRFENLKNYLNPVNKGDLCSSLLREGVDYIEIKNPTNLEDVTPNYSFFDDNFDRIYFYPEEGLSIYIVSISCKNER